MGDCREAVNTEEMASTSAAVTTVPPQPQEDSVERVAVITLRPTRARSRKKVVWTEDTVDNEHMNKKKSKCCCIYEKPRHFGESDSEESDDECEHCFGHVEHKHKKHTQHADTAIVETQAEATEPVAAITLKPEDPSTAPPHQDAT